VTEIEQDFLEQVANEYRSRGFRVVLRPQDEELPPFLQPFQPDFIALSDEENIVVEVRERGGLNRAPRINELAEALSGQPGWRLKYLIAPRDEDRLSTKSSFSPKRIREILDNAQSLCNDGDLVPAFLLAFSALEAAARRAADKYHIKPASPNTIAALKSAYSAGLMDQEDLDELVQLAEKRNALAHGFSGGRVTKADVRRVCRMARQLI
jgi:hypothetical protein